MFHLAGLEARIQASHDAAQRARVELAALITPAVLAELDRRAPAVHQPGDPIVLGLGPGMFGRGPGQPIEHYWRGWLIKYHGGQLDDEIERLARFSRWVDELRAKILEVAGLDRLAQFELACDQVLHENLLSYWRCRWVEVRVLHLVAEFCDHEWCYRGWWIYERETVRRGLEPDEGRNLDGDWGWLRGTPRKVHNYCGFVLGPDAAIPEFSDRNRGDDSFAGWFSTQFPGGLPLRVGRYGIYHRPECFSWDGDELGNDVACACGARPALVRSSLDDHPGAMPESFHTPEGLRGADVVSVGVDPTPKSAQRPRKSAAPPAKPPKDSKV